MAVVLDRDQTDCIALKQHIEDMARAAKLVTKSLADAGRQPHFQVLIRIAVEELEAWFFGDMEAIGIAYPRARRFLGDKRGLRDPDAILGGTGETLGRILQRAGYHKGGLDKLLAAREISTHMDPARNRSRSFLTLCKGLRAIPN